MKQATTTLTTHKGTIRHTGTSGFTVTATRIGDGVDTLIEWSETSLDELREMICVLLCMLDEKEGEEYVASCFGRYAQETGKKFLEAGDGHKLVMIRGERTRTDEASQ